MSDPQESAPPEAAVSEGGAPTAEEERERKQAKARRKREKAKEKERERELEIERENAEAGPSLRQIEVEQIQNQIAPLGFEIAEIPSDGNCLYRAVAAHSGTSYQETRKCAKLVNDHPKVPLTDSSSHSTRKSLRRHVAEKRVRVCPVLRIRRRQSA